MNTADAFAAWLKEIVTCGDRMEYLMCTLIRPNTVLQDSLVGSCLEVTARWRQLSQGIGPSAG